MSFTSQKIWFTSSSNFQFKLDESIFALCVPPDGGIILSGGHSGAVKIWDPVSGKLTDNIYLGSPVLHIIWVDINSHRNTFLAACEDGSICVYSCRAATFLRDSFLFKAFLPPRQYICALKTILPGTVESIDYKSGRFAAVGGGELRVCEVGARSTSLGHSSIEYSLSTPFSALLGPSLPTAIPNLNHKQPNTVHFISDDLIIASFVDLHPIGQSSILALVQLQPFRLLKAVEINRRVGSLAVNPSFKSFAITNLMDGIDIFTLPNLMHLGTIKHTLYPSSNVVLGITFIGNSYIISGGCGQIWISEAESLRVLAGLQGQETSIYRAVSGSVLSKLILAGSDDGRLCLWKFRDLDSGSFKWWNRLYPMSLPSQGTLCAMLAIVVTFYFPLFYLGVTSYRK